MKPLVIYHANCADGFGAAFAAWTVLGDDAAYVPLQYDERADFDMARFDGRDVYILDFSFAREQFEDIARRAADVTWLDHHKTAFDLWCPKHRHSSFTQTEVVTDSKPVPVGIILDLDKSGAMLAWEYFRPGTAVPMLIRYIDDYDRWQFKLEDTKAFIKALWSYAPWSFEQWRDNFALDSDAYGTVYEGLALLRDHNQKVAAVVRDATRGCSIRFDDDRLGALAPWDCRGYWFCNGLAANCPPHLTSDVGHELATLSGTFGLCWYYTKDGTIACSLRSNGDYDVSAIAKVFGGGGHKNAAGFTTDTITLLEWLK